MSETMPTMTAEEAIFCMGSYLPDSKDACPRCPYYGSVALDGQASTCLSSQGHRLAMEALGKQVPRPVVQEGDRRSCPTCIGTVPGGWEWDRCPHCGQLLSRQDG